MAMELPSKSPEKIRLAEINSCLTCYLCKGYLIDATTISECMHSFCRNCIIKFLHENNYYCPICEVKINKANPYLKLDKKLQDVVYKLVPQLFLKEMTRRKVFYQKEHPELWSKVSPEERGEDTERTIFNPQDLISLSMEHIGDDSSPGAIRLLSDPSSDDHLMKRYLQCSGMCRIEVLKKFVQNKYNVDSKLFYIDILYKRVPLPDHYTLIDIAYIYSYKMNEPMKFYFRITDINKITERFDYFDSKRAVTPVVVPPAPPEKPKTVLRANRKLLSLKNRQNAKQHKDSSPDQQKLELIKPSDPKLVNEAPLKADPVKSEEIKDEVPNEKLITSITLNRTNNLEIVTTTKLEDKLEDEKSLFFKSIQLAAIVTSPQNTQQKDTKITSPDNKICNNNESSSPNNIKVNENNGKITNLQPENNSVKKVEGSSPTTIAVKFETVKLTKKRKNSSPVKTDSVAKKVKVKSPLINGAKLPVITNNNNTLTVADKTLNNGLQSLIENCKIPSSLSITIKETTVSQSPVKIPPVQNYIEILKLPEEKESKEVKELSNKELSPKPAKLPDSEDSEQKVDADLSEIAKSLTDKIGPPLEPAPVPELVPEKTPVNGNKRNILDIALKLYKKSKTDQESDNNIQTQTVKNLHSSSLGLNYSVSVNQTKQNVASPNSKNDLDRNTESPPRLVINIPSETSPNGKVRKSPKKSPTKAIQPKPTSPVFDKFNIQNLAQLAGINFSSAPSPGANFGGFSTSNQLAALHNAMLLKHHIDSHQSWLNMNQGPLLQYEKFLQSQVRQNQNHLLGNIKEN